MNRPFEYLPRVKARHDLPKLEMNAPGLRGASPPRGALPSLRARPEAAAGAASASTFALFGASSAPSPQPADRFAPLAPRPSAHGLADVVRWAAPRVAPAAIEGARLGDPFRAWIAQLEQLNPTGLSQGPVATTLADGDALPISITNATAAGPTATERADALVARALAGLILFAAAGQLMFRVQTTFSKFMSLLLLAHLFGVEPALVILCLMAWAAWSLFDAGPALAAALERQRAAAFYVFFIVMALAITGVIAP